jgi:hypothetical protein
MADIMHTRAQAIIAGRDRIPATDAARALGRSSVAAVADAGLVPDADGLFDAEAVLDVLRARKARRVTAAIPRFDAPVMLRRTDESAWDVVLPRGRVGGIEVARYSAEPLAHPAPVLGVWFASWPDPIDPDAEFVAGAVSGPAAQVIVLRNTMPEAILPAWAVDVRELDHDLALVVQDVAEAKAAGKPLPESAGVLTPWEVEAVRPVVSERWRRWRSELLGKGVDAAEDSLADRVPGWQMGQMTVGLSLQTTGNPRQDERWSAKAVAAFLTDEQHRVVKPATVRAYAARGQMPAPDGRDERGWPWWLPATIRTWQASRPGRGARTDLR